MGLVGRGSMAGVQPLPLHPSPPALLHLPCPCPVGLAVAGRHARMGHRLAVRGACRWADEHMIYRRHGVS